MNGTVLSERKRSKHSRRSTRLVADNTTAHTGRTTGFRFDQLHAADQQPVTARNPVFDWSTTKRRPWTIKTERRAANRAARATRQAHR